MKTSIGLTALALLFSAGAFAATPKPHHHKTEMNMNKPVVSIIPLKEDRGFAARIDKMDDNKTVVIVYNNDGDAIFKDRLSNNRMGEKKYLLRDLDDGKYTLEVYSKGRDVKTNFFIYYNTITKRRVVDIM